MLDHQAMRVHALSLCVCVGSLLAKARLKARFLLPWHCAFIHPMHPLPISSLSDKVGETAPAGGRRIEWCVAVE